MSVCTFLPILIGLGGLFFGGLTAWAFFRNKVQKLTEKCQTAESDNVILWNSYTALQNELSQLRKEVAAGSIVYNENKSSPRKILKAEGEVNKK